MDDLIMWAVLLFIIFGGWLLVAWIASKFGSNDHIGDDNDRGQDGSGEWGG